MSDSPRWDDPVPDAHEDGGTMGRTRSATTEPSRSGRPGLGRRLASRVPRWPTPIPSHPLWWTALAALLLNDHVLKGSGLLPAEITGKLSDFAGMIVAPPLLMALVRARKPSVQLACTALVGGVFGAINVDPWAAATFAHLVGGAGVPWHTVVDPTDLIAMVMLPVGHRLGSTGALTGGPQTVVRTAGLVLGVLACVATGAPPPDRLTLPWSTHAYVVNTTADVQDVRVRFVVSEVNCDALGDELPRAMTPESFGRGITFRLQPDRTVPLNRIAAAAAAGIDIGEIGQPRACDIALITVDGMPDTVVRFDGMFTQSVRTVDDGTEIGRVAIVTALAGADGPLAVEAGLEVEVSTILLSPERSSCASQERWIFEWTQPPAPDAVLIGVETGDDGCLRLDLGDAATTADLAPMFLCIPAEAFPFVPGDHLFFEERPGRPTMDGTTSTGGEMRIATVDDSDRYEVLLRIATAQDEPPVELAWPDGSAACEGERLECDAYARAIQPLNDAGERIAPGATLDLGPRAPNERETAVFGRMEEIIVTGAECDPARRQLGRRLDWLTLREVL